MFAGIMGGTPCTGVLVRTAVNVASRANDKASQFLNAVTVLIITLTLLPSFTYIPMPCIASILMVSAFRLVPITVMKELWRVNKPELVILILTMLICVFMDGALGLMIGGAIALLRNAKDTGIVEIVKFNQDGEFVEIKVEGQFTYVNANLVEKRIKNSIKQNKGISYVLINLSEVPFIDVDGLECLKLIFKNSTVQLGVIAPSNDVGGNTLTSS